MNRTMCVGLALSHNLFGIPVTDIHRTKVTKTPFKGEVVHQGDSR